MVMEDKRLIQVVGMHPEAYGIRGHENASKKARGVCL